MAVGRLARNIVCSMIVFAIHQCTYSSDEVTVDLVILSAKKKPCEIDDETLQIGHCERVQRCTDRHIGCDIEVALAERNKEIK